MYRIFFFFWFKRMPIYCTKFGEYREVQRRKQITCILSIQRWALLKCLRISFKSFLYAHVFVAVTLLRPEVSVLR